MGPPTPPPTPVTKKEKLSHSCHLRKSCFSMASFLVYKYVQCTSSKFGGPWQAFLLAPCICNVFFQAHAGTLCFVTQFLCCHVKASVQHDEALVNKKAIQNQCSLKANAIVWQNGFGHFCQKGCHPKSWCSQEAYRDLH